MALPYGLIPLRPPDHINNGRGCNDAAPQPCQCRSPFQSLFACVQGYKPDYMYLLQRTMMDSPDAAVNLAKMIAKQPGPPIELNVIADLFLQRNMVREATAFLLEVLQDNNPEHEKLQTKASPPHACRCFCHLSLLRMCTASLAFHAGREARPPLIHDNRPPALLHGWLAGRE